MSDSTRVAIRSLVRRLTRSPSESQASTSYLNEKINIVLRYNLPSSLQLTALRKTFSFYTTPNIDTYSTITANTNDPMYDFKNAIINSSSPIYFAGYRGTLVQDRTMFYQTWPVNQAKVQIATGNGAATNFTGTLTSKPVTPSAVIFSSVDATGVAQQLIDQPLVSTVANQLGVELINGNMYDPRTVAPSTTVVVATNTINYVTGVYNITFSVAPATGKAINVQTVPYSAGRPWSALFFDNTFTLRPIPDDTYEVKIEAQVPGTELTDDTESPEIKQWWQYIGYAAAKLVFADRMDMESIAAIMPELKEQELFVLRRTLSQLDEERAETIYSSSRYGTRWLPFRSYR